MRLEVLKYPTPSLSKLSFPVEEFTPELKELAKNMAETMYAEDGIGLAAPQIGRNIRLIVVDVSGPSDRSDLRIYVNPVLEPLDDDFCESDEGCLSVPGFRSAVKRHARVRLRARDLDGNQIEDTADDILAICLQHECDHLDGKLFIDRISRLKRSFFDSRLKKRLKDEE